MRRPAHLTSVRIQKADTHKKTARGENEPTYRLSPCVCVQARQAIAAATETAAICAQHSTIHSFNRARTAVVK